ncbi:uncharacterized protein LOC121738066 [Aricia agestis]|uniref:uncharacterized protein LOC121738066 n=1 Tax=Aricia agestis TaxID=91739 RepID=UPI001C20ABC7|nr:uncharacterized protein LOC121738066 [Aricia agestis]
MPSKKRKYNARFPAGRIKKIMQQDEEVGKMAQAVPIVISRTLELFVESLLGKAMQVTAQRNAKTLSPSHVKQCILAESRFDFLRDLVKNIPDVTAGEEREMLSGESSPNSSRFSDTTVPRRVVREDSNSSSSSDVKVQQVLPALREKIIQRMTSEEKPNTLVPSPGIAIDLTVKQDKPVVTANFYQETLLDDHRSVIKVNPIYSPQPSTSTHTLTPMEPVKVPKQDIFLDVRNQPITPVLNIDFTKDLEKPEIKVLDPVANIAVKKKIQRQNSKKEKKPEVKFPAPVDLDHLNAGNLQIDEDYDT